MQRLLDDSVGELKPISLPRYGQDDLPKQGLVDGFHGVLGAPTENLGQRRDSETSAENTRYFEGFVARFRQSV